MCSFTYRNTSPHHKRIEYGSMQNVNADLKNLINCSALQ